MAAGQTILGRYEVFRKLGRGGMGDVYAANDLQLERKVALKAIRSEFRLDHGARARFLREARALSKLEHPSICRIHDYVTAEHEDYLVLELIEGTSLRDRLREGLDRAEGLHLAEQIGDALAAAHAEGLVHRDLKPSNVMVTPQGVAKILDFGLARSAVEQTASDSTRPVADRPPAPGAIPEETVFDERTITSASHGSDFSADDSITEVGSKIGTPRYMSPEQARGEDVRSASDMFAFGLLLHEMFTGERAYALPLGDELVEALSSGDSAKVHGLDRHLTDLIERLKSPAPSRRPTAVDAVARLHWIRGIPRRRLRWAGVVAAVALAAAAGVKHTMDLDRERAAAEFRRAQSDEHIEFMVEDLYEKLEPVGRIDILEEVGLKALEYFETLDENEKTDDDWARLGRTWTQIGHVRVAAGDYDGARDAFERSMSLHGDLVAKNGSRGDWQMGLSGAHFGVANVAWLIDDMEQATVHFERYLEISQTLVDLDPDNLTYQLELGYAWTNLAGLHRVTGELDLALEELTQAAAAKRKIVASDPENQRSRVSLANTMSWLTQIMIDRENYEAALGYADETLALRRDLAADERNTEAQEHLGIVLQQKGWVLSELGHDDDAVRAYREDIMISRRLSQLDPDNPQWRHGLAVSWNTLGEFYLQRGRFIEARPLLENALRDTRSLIELQPDDRKWNESFVDMRYNVALLELRQDRLDAALRVLEEGPQPEDPAAEIRESILMGRIHHRLGDRRAAANALDRAEQALVGDPDEERSREIAELRKILGK